MLCYECGFGMEAYRERFVCDVCGFRLDSKYVWRIMMENVQARYSTPRKDLSIALRKYRYLAGVGNGSERSETRRRMVDLLVRAGRPLHASKIQEGLFERITYEAIRYLFTTVPEVEEIYADTYAHIEVQQGRSVLDDLLDQLSL